MPTLVSAGGGFVKTSTTTILGGYLGVDMFPGDLIVFSLAFLGSTTGQTVSAVDSAGNTYTSVTNASLGSTTQNRHFIMYSILTNTLLSGGSISATLSTGTCSSNTWSTYLFKPLSGESFVGSVVTGNAISNQTGTTPSLASSTSYNANSIAFGTVAINGPNGDTWTCDTDTLSGTWSQTQGAIPGSTDAVTTGSTGGSAASNVSIRNQFKYITSSNIQTFNPTLGTSRTYGVSIINIPWSGTATFVPNNPMGMMGFFGI